MGVAGSAIILINMYLSCKRQYVSVSTSSNLKVTVYVSDECKSVDSVSMSI